MKKKKVAVAVNQQLFQFQFDCNRLLKAVKESLPRNLEIERKLFN